MIKKISSMILSAALGFCTQSYAVAPIQQFRLGMGMEYVLPVNEPQVFANPIIFTIKAVCTVTSENESNLLSFSVLRKSGTFNGTKLLTGDSMSYIVHNDETISITALPGAQVELVNLGEQNIMATCSVA